MATDEDGLLQHVAVTSEPPASGPMNTLRAGQLVLEPQVAAHAAELFVVLSDPAIYEFENAPPESEAWLEQRFARLESRCAANGEEQWLNWVIRLPSGAVAGYVQATVTSERAAQIAYELASKFWRQGIGSAAVDAMLGELAASYGVRTCAATLKSQNYRSLALLRKLGFGPEAPSGHSGSHEPDEVTMYKILGDSEPPVSGSHG